MPIEIQELHTSVEVAVPESLLSPQVLAQVVTAVLAALEARERPAQVRASELDLRPVIQQQRSKGGP